MEKELLQKKKDEILLCKEELIKLVNEAETLTDVNNRLNLKYEKIISYIEDLNETIIEYNQIKRVNKFSKILLIVSIIIVLGVLGISYLSSVPTALLSNMVAICTFSILTGVSSSIPYVSTTKYLKNINIEVSKSQLKLSEEEKKENRKLYEKNVNKIDSLMESNEKIYNSLYNATLELLNDEEICQDAMNYIINNRPSEEIIYTIADSIIETPKTKIKK